MPRFFVSPPFKDRPVLFIDFEMTGLDVQTHEIIEVAALVARPPNFEIISSYYSKIIPQHIETADPEALKVVSYDPKLWQDAISLRQMLQDLSRLAPNCILAGWAVQNEWNFLISALQQENLPYFFDEKLIEVYSLAYCKFFNSSDITRLNIANTAKLFGIPVERHKPDSDIRATYHIFRRLLTI